jgi:hypothetical protein
VPYQASGNALIVCRTFGLALAFLLVSVGTWAQDAQSLQDANTPKGKIQDGYLIHQTVDLGGRFLDSSGSGAMYDTLVNLQSGPRILSQTLDAHSLPGANHFLLDNLLVTNTGYGGDPNNVTTLRMSKGKLYTFQGLFRRDRQYSDYNLLDNPLVPPGVTSNGYTFPQVLNSPHLFNTVRRMTDVGLTLLPLSKVSFRAGYSQNISQGPSYSSQHNGPEAIYLQNWRNSTDTWLGAVDWKPIRKTTLTYEETVTHYKGNTNWQLAGANPLLTGTNLQLSNGTPVTLGFDNYTPPTCGDGNPPIVSSATTPPTANPTCAGYTGYSRYAPTRVLLPTEEFRFQSSTIKNVEMNGRARYTGGNMNLPSYAETFTGLDNMGNRVVATTGFANAKRINVSVDYGILWRISEKVNLSEQVDFWDTREPATSNLSEVDQPGTSMLLPPGAPVPPSLALDTIRIVPTFTGFKTTTNLATLDWEPSDKISFSLGYRYRARDITLRWNLNPLFPTDALGPGDSLPFPDYTFQIRENGGILSVAWRPTQQWRINGSVEVSYAGAAYTQLSPRALQHYRIQTRYKPKSWATISGSFNDLERRNNVSLISHLDHARSFALATTLMPNEHYGVDLSYGYTDIFSRTTLCFADPAFTGPGAGAAPADCGTNTNLGTGYYDAPTQYGSIGVTLAPVKKFRSGLGYRINDVSGTTEFLNPREVAGSLRSRYQTPYANLAWTIHPGWVWKGNWNRYRYKEDGPSGPTLPRNFRGDLYTFAVHYEF